MAQPAPLTTPYLTAQGYFKVPGALPYKHSIRDGTNVGLPSPSLLFPLPIILVFLWICNTFTALTRRNLAYLWASRTQDEEDACELLRQNAELILTNIDLSIMPARSVGKRWLPHVRAVGRGLDKPLLERDEGDGEGDAIQEPDLPVIDPPDPDLTVLDLIVEVRNPNTTAFSFWPQGGNTNAPIPEDDDDVNEIFESGTLIQDEGHNETSWHGVHQLRQGANGRAVL